MRRNINKLPKDTTKRWKNDGKNQPNWHMSK